VRVDWREGRVLKGKGMSAFVLLLAAGLAPGDSPEAAAGEVEQRLNLRGRWAGAWYGDGGPLKVRMDDGNLTVFTSNGLPCFGGPLRMTDEGVGRCCCVVADRVSLPGIYRQEGDRLLICFRWPRASRPASFWGGDSQVLLILRRVPPKK
jgi:hypothetical protein